MTDLREAAQMALPCPFCGGKDISTHEGSTFRWHVAECMTCGAQGSEVRRQTLGQGTTDLWIKKAAADAIAEWNTRARLAQPEQDDGYCQACEGNYCTAKDGCVARDNPPQREWQGLTDKEIKKARQERFFLGYMCKYDMLTFAHAIEAKLKEKNGF